MFAVLAAVLAFAVADEPQAAQAAEPEMSAAERRRAEREAELDRVVCRREHVVGSNRPQRVCLTVREWEHARDRARDHMDESGRRGGDPSTVQTNM